METTLGTSGRKTGDAKVRKSDPGGTASQRSKKDRSLGNAPKEEVSTMATEKEEK